MRRINLGLIGYGVVGQGVARYFARHQKTLQRQYEAEFVLRTICDRSIDKKDTRGLGNPRLTTQFDDVLKDEAIDIVIELIGGKAPAKALIKSALKSGKDVVTANKDLIANYGPELFSLAQNHKRCLCFESAVAAGVPVIKTVVQGVAGNQFKGLYGIINGTCNFILDEMSERNLRFEEALKEAQARGYAESDPTLDINGMDATHKLAVLIYLAFGKQIKVKEIYTEGIDHISHDDIDQARQLNLVIKLLAITKRHKNTIEARVHPTLIARDHPLAAIHGIYNALYLDMAPLGKVLLSGEGAGQMAAASGVISDVINIVTGRAGDIFLPGTTRETESLTIRAIDDIETKFYLRFMAVDRPGVLSKITAILGDHGIGINSVTQKAHNKAAAVPVIMLTDYTTEKVLRRALNAIHRLAVIKSRPVAIRMEKL